MYSWFHYVNTNFDHRLSLNCATYITLHRSSAELSTTSWSVGDQWYQFLISAVGECEWSASRYGHFTFASMNLKAVLEWVAKIFLVRREEFYYSFQKYKLLEWKQTFESGTRLVHVFGLESIGLTNTIIGWISSFHIHAGNCTPK